MIRALAITIIVLSTAVTASANLAVRRAYYRDSNLSIHVFVQNRGSQPVTLPPPVVNGFDTAKLGRDGKTAASVLWYRCRPNAIAPGGIADLTITLAESPTEPILVELPTTSGQRLKATVQCTKEAFRFQAIRFSSDLRTIYLYLYWADGSSGDALKRIRIDGCLGKVTSPWPANSIDGLAYAEIKLDKPLVKGSYHTFEAETGSGLTTAYQIRAIPAEFLIGLYGSPSAENIQDWAAHSCNHYLSFGALNADVVSALASSGLSSGARYIPQHLADRQAGNVLAFDEAESRNILQSFVGNKNLLYHSLVDEPDAGDYYCGRRIGASAMELVARDQFCQQVDPEHYSFVQLDNTFRPRSYAVYGESADVLATHRYSLGNYLGGEAGTTKSSNPPFLEDLRDTIGKLRTATAPKPFFMVTQFFDIGPGRQGRSQTIEEMRLQCYAMVAGGARGLIHYIHSGSSGGHEGGKSTELWNAMTAMHQELRRVGEVVQSGTPAPDSWVKTSSANIYANAIISGDGIAMILINRAHRSALQQFTARPIGNVTVTVRIPPWMSAAKLAAVAADNMQPVAVSAGTQQLSFTVDQIKDASCVILQPKTR